MFKERKSHTVRAVLHEKSWTDLITNVLHFFSGLFHLRISTSLMHFEINLLSWILNRNRRLLTGWQIKITVLLKRRGRRKNNWLVLRISHWIIWHAGSRFLFRMRPHYHHNIQAGFVLLWFLTDVGLATNITCNHRNYNFLACDWF